MIAGQALADWFADRGAQGATLAAAQEFGRRLRREPAVAALEAELAAAPDDGDEILAVAGRFLVREDWVRSSVEAMAAQALADGFFRPGLGTASTDLSHGLVMFDTPRLTVLLGTLSAEGLAAKRTLGDGPASITFGGQRTLYRFLRSGEATLSFWEAPAIDAGFTAAASGRCRPSGRRRIEDGEMLALDGSRHSFVIDHAASDMVYLHASTPVDAAPLAVEYDAASLAFAGASSTDQTGSRIQMMLSLLRVMDRRDAVPLFREALRARDFHGRWHAMREFLALDAGEALPHLREMAATDPHPEVRGAAAQTLAVLFEPASHAEEECAEPCPA